jgi:ribose transport system substrate-binding protein
MGNALNHMEFLQICSVMSRLNKFALGLTVACTMIACGCREQPPTVGVIPRTTGTLLWEPMHLGVAEVARASGLHIYWNAPADEGEIDKQLNFIRRSLSRRYRGLILAPDETLACRSLVLSATQDRIPVVIVDDELGPPPGPFLSYVSNDEVVGTRLAADRIAKILHGSGSVAVIGISPRLESGILREEAFEKALSLIAPDVRIVERRYGDSVVAHQQQIAEEIMNGTRHIDVVVALSATATLGAYFAKLEATPLSAVQLIGFDQGLLLPVQSGEVDSIVVQNTRKIGQIAMQNVSAQLRGKKVNGVTLVAPMLLTRETIAVPEIKSQWEFSRYRWDNQ